MQRCFRIFCLLLISLMVAAIPAQAQNAPVQTTITSQRVQYDTNAQTIIFTGNVHVVRPDVQIWSERLTVILAKNASGNTSTAEGISASEIEKLIAERNVRMTMGERNGNCDKATYTTTDELLVMEGNPRLYEGTNSITGEKILFYVAEDRSEVIGSSNKPVRVIFTDTTSGQR